MKKDMRKNVYVFCVASKHSVYSVMWSILLYVNLHLPTISKPQMIRRLILEGIVRE